MEAFEDRGSLASKPRKPNANSSVSGKRLRNKAGSRPNFILEPSCCGKERKESDRCRDGAEG